MAKPKQTVAKSPWAVAVGERLRQARRMAKFENVEKLLERMPGWEDKRSRLTNYEAGISLAPPEAILDIARATGCSECWLMFGAGPIRSTGRDLQAIRHQNFVYVVGQAKDSKRSKMLLSSLGLSPIKIEEMIANPPNPITDRIARRCERFLKKASGWMDEQHIENDPVCQTFPDEMRELMRIYSDLPAVGRAMILDIARTIRSHTQLNAN